MSCILVTSKDHFGLPPERQELFRFQDTFLGTSWDVLLNLTSAEECFESFSFILLLIISSLLMYQKKRHVGCMSKFYWKGSTIPVMVYVFFANSITKIKISLELDCSTVWQVLSPSVGLVWLILSGFGKWCWETWNVGTSEHRTTITICIKTLFLDFFWTSVAMLFGPTFRASQSHMYVSIYLSFGYFTSKQEPNNYYHLAKARSKPIMRKNSAHNFAALPYEGS